MQPIDSIQLLNSFSQYERGVHTADVRPAYRVEQPIIKLSYTLIIVPLLFIFVGAVIVPKAIALYQAYRSKQLYKQIKILEQLREFDQNN